MFWQVNYMNIIKYMSKTYKHFQLTPRQPEYLTCREAKLPQNLPDQAVDVILPNVMTTDFKTFKIYINLYYFKDLVEWF